MAHFAEIDENGIVKRVIVAEQEVIDSGIFGDPNNWIQTSYNTHAGKHPEGRPLRKNYAGIGYVYDKQRDAFIPPKPFASWTLDEETGLWKPPSEAPQDGKDYKWNENKKEWEDVSGI